MKYGRATTDLHAKSNMQNKQISQYKRTFVQVIVTLRQSKIQLVARSLIGKIFSGGTNW